MSEQTAEGSATIAITYDSEGPGYSVFADGRRIHGPAYLFGRPDGCVEFCRAQGWRVEKRVRPGQGVAYEVTP